MSATETENGKKELKITFDTIRDKNVEQLRMLNNVLFPIKYQVRRPRRTPYHPLRQEKYYKECLASEDISQFASFNSVSIGAIVCRVEQQVSTNFEPKLRFIEFKDDDERKLYIMTLGVLAPYRQLGVGTKLLQKALQQASLRPRIAEAYLHVQPSNEAAISFYQKSGFEVAETIPDYYTRLQPQTAVVLRKPLEQD